MYVILFKSINLNYVLYIIVTLKTTVAERIENNGPMWL